MSNTKADRIELVALYRAEIEGGGYAQVVAPRTLVEQAKRILDLKGKTSLFKNGARTMSPGGIYSAPGDLGEDGRIERLNIKAASYQGQADIDEAWRALWQGFEAEIQDKKDAELGERKAKKESMATRHIEALAKLASRMPANQRSSFTYSLQRQILKRAHQIAEKSK